MSSFFLYKLQNKMQSNEIQCIKFVFMIDIPTYIRKTRHKKRLSMEAVADYIGCSYQSYQGYESGKTKLVHPYFYKIIEFLEIDPVDLFGDADSEKNKNLIVSEPIHYYNDRIKELDKRNIELIAENAVLAYRLSQIETDASEKPKKKYGTM